MCGRFTITTDRVDFILKKFHAVAAPGFDGLKPRYNAAPGQYVPALVSKEGGQRYLTDMFWGFVPPWGEKGTKGNTYQANIRDDTIARNAFFRSRLLTGRCVLLADGFYEWKKPPGYEHLGRGERLPRGVRKIPHRILMKDRSPFPLAGLWRTVEIEARPVVTAGIITTSPNRIVEPIHDRMPVILGETETLTWLDPSVGDFAALHSLLRPFPHSEMEAYAVSDAVNNSRFDSPECVEPLEDTASGRE